MSAEELLPCPFCGGHPVTTEAMSEHWVSCGTCTASATMKGKLKEAIAAWNRRTPPAMSADHIGDATNMVASLRAFAAGCRGSMWQSRDETIRLCDEAANLIEALHPPQPDALPGDLRERVDGLLARYFPETLKDERGTACGVSFVVREQRAELVEYILALIQTERVG